MSDTGGPVWLRSMRLGESGHGDIRRRTVARGIAWTGPVVIVGAAAPALAASASLGATLSYGIAQYTECGDICWSNPERYPPFLGLGARRDVTDTTANPARGYSFPYTATATVDAGVITRAWSGHTGGNCRGDWPGPLLNSATATVDGIAQDKGLYNYTFHIIFETEGASSISVTVTASGRGSVTETLVLTP